jgi:hypothetical protein
MDSLSNKLRLLWAPISLSRVVDMLSALRGFAGALPGARDTADDFARG